MFSQSIKQIALNCPTELRRQELAADNNHHNKISPYLTSKFSQWISKKYKGIKYTKILLLDLISYRLLSRFQKLHTVENPSYVKIQKFAEFLGNNLNKWNYELGCTNIFRIKCCFKIIWELPKTTKNLKIWIIYKELHIVGFLTFYKKINDSKEFFNFKNSFRDVTK